MPIRPKEMFVVGERSGRADVDLALADDSWRFVVATLKGSVAAVTSD